MKTKTLITVFLLFLMTLGSRAQVYVSGHVTEIGSGNPIPNYEVYLSMDSSMYFNIIYTDELGYYADTIPEIVNQGALNIYVFDCYNVVHDTLILDPPAFVNADFSICYEYIPLECNAYYFPVRDEQDLFTYNFVNLSYLEPGYDYEFLWDFGDGHTSDEFSPIHTYTDTGLYEVCLTITDNMGICNDTYCSMVEVPFAGGECIAYFVCQPDFSDPLTFEFFDYSFGPHDQWFWEFGDGVSSDLPFPVHTFNEPGEYNVCLTIIDSTGICHDTYCETIEVGIVEPCEAKFDFIFNPNNYREVHFTDMSYGNILNWEWDFGDGTTSSEPSPTHVFLEDGVYNVCLTISNDDIVANCYDSVCATVIIVDTTITCVADFSARPDSVSVSKNLFFFTDKSTGNPNQWFWDFGDGNYSEEQNPSHQYETPGTYEVCMTIFNGQNPENCNDSICKLIVTPEYYHFGGKAFAGDFPLNNPVSTGDTGVAFLYRMFPSGHVLPVDTNIFYNNFGYYVFSNIMEGEYIVRIGLTKNSARYSEYFPTYTGNFLKWDEATEIALYDTMFSEDVHMLPTVNNGNGNGRIEGNVTWCASNMIRQDSLADVLIILSDGWGSPLSYTFTDVLGHFNFSNIPNGDYRLYADFTGGYSATALASISNDNLFEDVLIELCQYVGIEENDTYESLDLIDLYPNPVNSRLYIDFRIALSGNVDLLVYDVLGNVVSQDIISGNTSSSTTHSIDVSGLKKGMYLVRIHTGLGTEILNKKFIKD